MNLKFTLLLAGVVSFSAAKAQEMSGFRTDNYNGVNGGFFNPANLGNSPFKLDINIFGINASSANQHIKLKLATITDAGDSNSLTTIIGDKPNNMLTNVALHLPSVAYRINENTSLALLTRMRVINNIQELDGKLISAISNSDVQLPYTLTGNTNMRVNVNMFAEIGLSGSHVVYNEGNHFIKVGATLKYLAGVQNYYLQLNKISGTIDTTVGGDVVLRNASGNLAIGGGGMDFEGEDIQFEVNGSGFGADLGAVYEYRPESLKGESIPYLFKANMAILDLGSIKYTSVSNTYSYGINIPAGQQFELNKFDDKSGSEINDVLDANPQYFTRGSGISGSQYRVSLPRTIQFGGDFRATKNVFIAANVQLAMNNNETKAYNPTAMNSFMITPRYESTLLAAYLPISYNNFSKLNMGIGFRAGPLYAGSSSMLSRAFGNSKQIDFYFGFRVGFKTKQKKENKEG